MTATPLTSTEFYPEGIGTQLPAGANVFLQGSNAQIGLGQLATFDASGNAALNDGSVPCVAAAGVGWPAKISDSNATAGIAKTGMFWGFCGKAFSTLAGDGFTAADIGGTPAWGATENTLGRLSNAAGKNRPLLGMVYGLNDDGTARFWGGPVAQSVARAFLLAQNHSAGAIAYPADASASTDIGSTTVSTSALMIPRTKLHGFITSIEMIPSATQTVTSGNNRTITIFKVDTLGVAADVIVATFVSTTAMPAPNAANCLTAHIPSLFTLSATAGALNMLETDILCYSTVHASSGVAFPQSAIRVNFSEI